ncbi:MAG: stage V sporulation protein M [Clostridiales bacterium]|nr:stage V sporulation protein M [Clostridiales bacterium]
MRAGLSFQAAGGDKMRVRMVCIRLPKFMGGIVRKMAGRRR